MVPLVPNITYKRWYHFDKGVRLQRIKAYSKDDREQFKYQITLPKDSIEKLGWKEGSELKDSVHDKSLVIDFVSLPVRKEKREIETKMTYEEFKDKINEALQYNDKGMTWTELRAFLKLDQVVPNNKWVRLLEKDIGLLRLKGTDGVVWRVKHV